MFGKRRTNQGGSVASFAVVGIILTAVLIGGLYLVNIRGHQARENQEIATSETKKTKSNDDGKTESGTATAENKSDKVTDNVDPAVNTASGEFSSQYLPETGFDIKPIQLVGVYLLVTSSIAYVLSRRELTRSL